MSRTYHHLSSHRARQRKGGGCNCGYRGCGWEYWGRDAGRNWGARQIGARRLLARIRRIRDKRVVREEVRMMEEDDA